jgi:hypothetical protein
MAFAEMRRREARGEDGVAGRDVLEGIVSDPWTAYEQLPLAEWPRQVPLLASYGEWLAHPARDEFWRATAVNKRYPATMLVR